MSENDAARYNPLLEAMLQAADGDVNAALELTHQQFDNTEVVEPGDEFLLKRLTEIRKAAPLELFEGQTVLVPNVTIYRTDTEE